jgi:Zn-finger nucleic acid-binding protein
MVTFQGYPNSDHVRQTLHYYDKYLRETIYKKERLKKKKKERLILDDGFSPRMVGSIVLDLR